MAVEAILRRSGTGSGSLACFRTPLLLTCCWKEVEQVASSFFSVLSIVALDSTATYVFGSFPARHELWCVGAGMAFRGRRLRRVGVAPCSDRAGVFKFKHRGPVGVSGCQGRARMLALVVGRVAMGIGATGRRMISGKAGSGGIGYGLMNP
jgi:hypothetical protein